MTDRVRDLNEAVSFWAPTTMHDVWPGGRRCSVDGCITILNRYNARPECLAHAASHDHLAADDFKAAA